MSPRALRRLLLTLAVVASPGAMLAACGSRTPLLVPDAVDAEAGLDVRPDRQRDTGPDTQLPGLDATPLDANRNDCPDADATLIYVVTNTRQLLSFNPPAASFKLIGTLACPAPIGANPFSMGVDRKGVAYVLYQDNGGGFGGLFKVGTGTLACSATPFTQTAIFDTFGMGFATIGAGPAEELFIIANDGNVGKIDVSSYKVTNVGLTNPAITWAELTGTGDGRLYAFFTNDNGPGTGIAEVDKSNAKIVGQNLMPTLDRGTAWAFAFWGGDFYTFTEAGGGSQVHRYRPADKSLTLVATYGAPIVGAGVSTCAPSQ